MKKQSFEKQIHQKENTKEKAKQTNRQNRGKERESEGEKEWKTVKIHSQDNQETETRVNEPPVYFSSRKAFICLTNSFSEVIFLVPELGLNALFWYGGQGRQSRLKRGGGGAWMTKWQIGMIKAAPTRVTVFL